MAVAAIEVVMIAIVVVVWVEAVALGCKCFLLVSSTSLTTSPVIFNFTYQTVPKIMLLHSFDNLNTDDMLWISSPSRLKIPWNFHLHTLGHSCNSNHISSIDIPS